ncbi:hypothetical protein, partial [Nostoc sp.]|uniref:hypothetical protein n=1 Tax=Nostoc sp. TaxID=1180 RepID=UPI002FF739CA
VTVGFWHEYSRILQRNSLYTLRPNHNGDCYNTPGLRMVKFFFSINVFSFNCVSLEIEFY